MLKLDPCSFNKAVIEKIKSLNKNETQEAQKIVDKRAMVHDMRKEIERGIRHMQYLDQALRETEEAKKHMLSNDSS